MALTPENSRLRWRRKRSQSEAARAPEAQTLHLHACEYVTVADDQAMVRIALRWVPEAPREVALHIDDQIVQPLPPGPTTGDDGLWRAGFALPTTECSSLALVTDTGARVELPSHEPAGPALEAAAAVETPEPPPVAPAPEPVARTEPLPEPEPAPQPGPPLQTQPQTDVEQQLADALEDLADAKALVAQLRKRCELSERGVTEFREKLVQAWSEANSMRLLLDERETAHVQAKERARQVDAEIAAVERRLAEREHALVASRDELKRHCDALENELVRRARTEREARARADAASERETRLQSEAGAATARAEESRVAADQLRAQVEAAQAAAAQGRLDVTKARERIAELEGDAARAVAAHEQATAEAAALRGQVETAHAEAERARSELAALHERGTQLQAEAADALARFEQARSEADQARSELASARELAEKTNAELASAREELTTLRESTIALSQSEHALRTQLDSLTRGDVGNAGLMQRRQKVSARAYQDAVAQLEAEQSERARLEAELAALGARIRELESAKPVTVEPAPVSEALAQRVQEMEAQLEARHEIEADLRRVLETTQDELTSARAELAEARGRLAVTPTEPQPVEPAGDDAPASPPWSGVDQELIERIAKANQLAGADG